MAIVVIGGSGRGVGKTALVCGLVRTFSEMGWTAVKITSHEHWKIEPIWEENEPGEETDTARYLDAGARRAFLLSAPERRDMNETSLGLIVGEFFRYAGRGTNVIFESNRVLHHVQPNLCLMVQGGAEAGAPKASYMRASALADAIVACAPADGFHQSTGRAAGRPQPLIHLARLEQISPAMESWIRERLSA